MNAEPAVWDSFPAILAQAKRAQGEGDGLRAHTLYVRATQLEPRDPAAWVGRAEVSPDLDDAILSLAHAQALDPHESETRAILIKKVNERVALSKAPDAPDLLALGRDLAQIGQKEYARQFFVRATELDANLEEGWIWRAGVSESVSDAVVSLNRALALNPENKKALAGLRSSLKKELPPAEAVTADATERAASQLAEGLRLLGMGDKARAHEYFLGATQLDPYNESAWLWRGSTTADLDEALLCVERALVINPHNTAARDAQRFLLRRKLGETLRPRAADTVAPIQVSVEADSPDAYGRVLLLAIAIIVLLLLLYNLLRNAGYVP